VTLLTRNWKPSRTPATGVGSNGAANFGSVVAYGSPRAANCTKGFVMYTLSHPLVQKAGLVMLANVELASVVAVAPSSAAASLLPTAPNGASIAALLRTSPPTASAVLPALQALPQAGSRRCAHRQRRGGHFDGTCEQSCPERLERSHSRTRVCRVVENLVGEVVHHICTSLATGLRRPAMPVRIGVHNWIIPNVAVEVERLRVAKHGVRHCRWFGGPVGRHKPAAAAAVIPGTKIV
jgi:hypothetical protein